MGIFAESFLTYFLIGFGAQLVDGALGMAFGLICTTFLLASGLPPVTVSASVHAAEVFTTAASGISHFSFKNIDRRLFARLIVPGVTGGCIGAYLLSNLPGNTLKPFIVLYLIAIGGVIFVKAIKNAGKRRILDNLPSVPYTTTVGFAGGFLDAIGGGGWGPIVTSNLIVRGDSPRHIIGTVSAAEFFLTLSISAVFITTGGLEFSTAILGLITGGTLAAPLAAFAVRTLPQRGLMGLVGVLVVGTGLYQLWLLFI